MKLLFALVFLLMLAGCATSLPKVEPEKLPAVPAEFKENWTIASPAAAQARGEWWKAFNDPVLDELVARAERNNTSIQLAATRLARARAVARATDADRWPQVGVGASAQRFQGIVNGNPPGPARSVFSTGVDLSYEVDLFGRLSHASAAAKLDAQASEALLQSARLLIQAEVAQNYLAVRALDDERSLVRSTVGAYRETLSLTERRWRAGDVAELDVARASTEVSATESEALALDRRRAELEHALAVLLGEAPSAFTLAPAEWSTMLPVIPAGVPATVLTRRPDVSAAQNGVMAAQARVGVAKAAWFPNIALTASGGYASPELSDLFQWSARAWGIGALLSLPLIDGGRRKAGVQAASADFDGAMASYREQVLIAFKDVEDQLAALRLLTDQAEAQARAVASSSRTTALSNARYRGGYVSQLDLLDAQRSELRNRRQALQVRSARYQSTVALVRALGGSWE
ncbi:MAG TPA: efflux transporter outer membrane subunit [Burkholderiales bacterium]|nr:efflux transporter outer membrane subunit [Burkholderiales bacterium]